MDGCSTIIEVMEPSKCEGDGLPIEGAEFKSKDEDGPWNERSVISRTRKMLSSGFMADLTIIVQKETFRCHSLILSGASPQLAEMIRKNSCELRLHDVDPRHFRTLLEIVYTDEANEFHDVYKVMAVARTAHKLRVFSALEYCTELLGRKITAKHLFPILDLALLLSDEELKKACMDVLRKETSALLMENFKRCKLSILELILSDDELQGVTELELFQACANWAETREHPRQALGSALGLIRFHLLTAQQFAKHVKPTKLLSAAEESDIFSCLVTKEGVMPAGFSNEKRARNQVTSAIKESILGNYSSSTISARLQPQQQYRPLFSYQPEFYPNFMPFNVPRWTPPALATPRLPLFKKKSKKN